MTVHEFDVWLPCFCSFRWSRAAVAVPRRPRRRRRSRSSPEHGAAPDDPAGSTGHSLVPRSHRQRDVHVRGGPQTNLQSFCTTIHRSENGWLLDHPDVININDSCNTPPAQISTQGEYNVLRADAAGHLGASRTQKPAASRAASPESIAPSRSTGSVTPSRE